MSSQLKLTAITMSIFAGLLAGLVPALLVSSGQAHSEQDATVLTQQDRAVGRRSGTGKIVRTVEIPLRDLKGNVALILSVSQEGQRADIAFLDTNHHVLYTLEAPKQSLRALTPAPDPQGKADDANPEDIQFLQNQIDGLRARLNEAIDRLNVLSR